MPGPLPDIAGAIRPSLDTDDTYYHDDDIVASYAEDRRGTRGGQYIGGREQDWLRTFFEHHGHDWDADDGLADATVLDVGGGPGTVTDQLTARGADVTYIDLSPVMAREARRAGTGDADYCIGDATDLPFSDDAVDYAISQRTAHVIPDDAFPDYVTELGRVAATGAQFDMFRTPSARDLYSWTLPMPSTLHTDTAVEDTVADTPYDIDAVDHAFVLPYGAFRRVDNTVAVTGLRHVNAALETAVPSLASVSVYRLDTDEPV